MSSIRPRRSLKVAKGTFWHGRATIACRFDDDMLDAINMHAIAINVPFAEMIRIFVREGLKRRREEARRAA